MKTIVFDLDGTLIDSAADISACFGHSLSNLGLTVPARDEVYPLIGQPLREMFAQFAPEAYLTPLVEAYRNHFPAVWTERTRPFEGVPETLATLRERGYGLVVATSKETQTAQALAGELGLDAYFDHIQGTDAFPPKPAPDVIFRALEAVSGEGSWMVGDTLADMQAGNAAGLKTYGVSWGTHDAATLERAAATVHADLGALLTYLP